MSSTEREIRESEELRVKPPGNETLSQRFSEKANADMKFKARATISSEVDVGNYELANREALFEKYSVTLPSTLTQR